MVLLIRSTTRTGRGEHEQGQERADEDEDEEEGEDEEDQEELQEEEVTQVLVLPQVLMEIMEQVLTQVIQVTQVLQELVLVKEELDLMVMQEMHHHLHNYQEVIGTISHEVVIQHLV